jgi:signal transduction histidine kinase
MTATLLPDKKSFLVITKNVTALKLIEDQSRLASMGEMIGNIAHQWRQPLSVISTASTGILFHKEMGSLTDELVEKEMNTINDNAQYLSQTIDDFRDFIKGETKFSTIKIKDIIDGSLSIVQAAIKNHYITLDIDVDDSLSVYGSKNELEQVLINIINNSKDIIVAKNIADGYISIKTEITEDGFNLIICDNGGGIPEEVLPRIFEPYYTTKHKSKGTGLGLSMAEKIIRERHQQTIEAYNDHIEHDGKNYTVV